MTQPDTQGYGVIGGSVSDPSAASNSSRGYSSIDESVHDSSGIAGYNLLHDSYRRVGMVIGVVGSLITFIVALLVGGVTIYISARVVAGIDDYRHVVITAFVGAIAWGVTSWIPLSGPVIALIAWITVIDSPYPRNWMNAVLIDRVTWV